MLRSLAIIIVTCAVWTILFPLIYSHLPESVSKHLGIVFSVGPNNALGVVICITPENDCKDIVDAKVSAAKESQGALAVLRFWTPSPKTAASFVAYEEGANHPNAPSEEAWQKNVGNDAVQTFAGKLAALDGVKGFRRFESFGRGRTFFKEGYWWEATVTTDFKIDNFKTIYRELCNGCASTYVELAHADRGQYDSVLKAQAVDSASAK